MPLVPASVFEQSRECDLLPSTITFMVNAGEVFCPQTGHPWYVEMDHEMGNVEFYSLVPQKNDNQFVSHYRVDRRRPRLTSFEFMDVWLTTNRRKVGDLYFSQTFYHPERADDKLYFERPPMRRLEILVEGFIGDREIFHLLESVIPKEYQIESLLQRRP